jgi:hypothetical protein
MLSCGAAASVTVLLAGAWMTTVATAAPIAPSATPLYAGSSVNPFDSGRHCNSQVCIDVSSAGGSGPDIQSASVTTNGGWSLPSGTAVYLQYGPSARAARRRPPLETQRTSGGGMIGYNFAVFRTLRTGWDLCGRIQGVSGYPCITIGKRS